MEKYEKNQKVVKTAILHNVTADLRGRQSVRATFRLSEKAIEAISIVSVHLGIKQKSLFDHLIEDAQTLNAIAEEARTTELQHLDRIQKTYVLSRKTLSMLDRIAERFNTPRDALVEHSILSLLPVIRQEQEKHENRKALLGEIRSNLKDGLKILKKAAEELGEEDPVHTKLEAAMSVYASSHQAIEAFIERCKIIEDFDPDILESFLNKSGDSSG